MFVFLLITTILSLSCDADHCSECSGKTCKACEDGYMLSNTECSKCHETCKKCAQASYPAQCTECYDGFYLHKSYSSSNYGTCKQCSADGLCAKCNQYSPYKCTECVLNSYLDKSTSTPTCKKCYASCETCSGPEENQCLTCMDGFYKTDDNRCEPCGNECKKCENNTKCNICNEHFYPDSSYQCQECHESCKACHGSTLNDCDECYDGYYDLNGLCRQCDPNCKTCKGSRNLCTSCEDGKYLDVKNRFCLDCDPSCKTCNNPDSCETCHDGFYQRSKKEKCFSCDDGDNCINCVYNNNHNDVLCTSCQLGYYPSSVSGVTGAFNCKLGTYKGCLNYTSMYSCNKCMDRFYLSSTSCRECEKSCLTCTNASVCTSCPIGYYLNSNSLCEECLPNCIDCDNSSVCTQCAEKYYLSNGVCEKCDESCQTCNDDTNACTRCASGYYFNQFKRCIKCGDNCDKCLDSTHCLDCATEFFVAPDGSCSPCADVCFECTGPTAADCIECDPGFYLSNSLKKCFKCHEACTDCYGPNDYECTKCSPGYFLNEKQCVKCEYGCKNCTSTTKCIECNEGFYLTRDNCVHCNEGCKSCPSGVDKCTECLTGFYESNRDGNIVSCSMCPEDCVSCSQSDSGDIVCNNCYDGFYLKNEICEKCSSPCETCTSEKVCKTCIKGHLLGSDSSCSSVCSSSCATCENTPDSCTSCKDGFILNGTVCLQCPNNCKTCEIEGGSSYCTSCLDGFYLDKKECFACHETCATCKNQSKSSCYTCHEGYYKDRQNNDYTGTCSLCSSYTTHCAKCTSDCSSSTYCSFSCNECDYGYYFANNRCQSCHSTCKTCDGPSDQNCVDCTDDYFLQDGKCVSCDSSCQTCKGSSTNCTSCKSHQYLENGKCLECDDSCIDCIDGNTCTKCADYQFLHEGKCLKSCLQIGEGWGSTPNFECKKCDLDNCIEYDDSCQCILCAEGFYIVSDPITLIEICLPCQLENCKACNGPEKNDCTDCVPGFEIKIDQTTGDKICGSICGDGYFPNINNECEKCASPCKICSGIDGSICTECEDGYFSNGTSCGVLPSDCELAKHCENENKGEKPVQIKIEISKFDSYKNEKGGGALRLVNCGLECETAEFNDCTSTKGGGGAIFIFNEKEQDYFITLKGLTFTACKAAFGGAIYTYSIAEKSPVLIQSCNFIDNDVFQTKANDENKLIGGSALYLIVKNGSVSLSSFVKHNKSLVSFVKVSKDFDIHPEELRMLHHGEINSNQETVVINKCSFHVDENSSMIYYVEKQTSQIDVDDYFANEINGIKKKSDQLNDDLKRELNSKFIEFNSDNPVSQKKKEFVVEMRNSTKLLLVVVSFGLIVLIISIITISKRNNENDLSNDFSI